MGRELDMLVVPVLVDNKSTGHKYFDALLEAASYAADIISLWEKHAARWSLQMTALETFIHSTMSLFDCGLIVSEFFIGLRSGTLLAGKKTSGYLSSV